ncbi:HEAT repeat domain-containing protein [Gordonia sp. 'Campus']|uniref:HEAT repeat domain-containing protein n=1 Tax=Gordonia sp. 'Campus' TaxID=2915824 RepID=UPI001EE4BDD7|nr:HEAT repeat domain-containing protein [Gordonia sp. 'Campus']
MTDQTIRPSDRAVMAALAAGDASTRLRAAMAAGTDPHPALTDDLVARCGVEPDFFVRDMLTWALTRLPADLTVPRLVVELGSGSAQARAQALHTLSKIGHPSAWPAITPELLHDADDEVARTAWRAAAVLVPPGRETWLANELAGELGRGEPDVQRSLSRALVELGDAASGPLSTAKKRGPAAVRAHVAATEKLIDDPDSDFAAALDFASRLAGSGAPADDPDADR